MKLVALALVALLLVPAGRAQEAAPEYPRELLALLPAWIAEAEALADDADRARPSWATAADFLARAKTAQQEGRFRVTLFHLETYRELVIGNRLIDEARASGGSKTLVLQNTSATHDDAERAWLAFRAKLHAYDGQLRSLQTVEKALYAADIGLAGALSATDHEALASEYPKQDGIAEGYVFGLVRASHTALLNIRIADSILTKAVEQEGLPPQLVAENWTLLADQAIAYGGGEEPPAFLEQIHEVGQPARDNGEGLLSVAALLAEQRAARANSMQTIFGDARTRGLDVVNDAARGMRRVLDETTMETPRSYGLSGVFTADAMDRAQVTVDYLEAGTADLGTVIVAWSSLEHQAYALDALASASPVVPPPATPTEKGAPGPGPFVLVAGLGAAALLARRR